MIHIFVLGEDEAETLIEALSGIEGLNVDGEYFGGGLRLFLQFTEKMRADALTAKFRQKGDIHDADLFGPMIDVKTACGHFAAEDDKALCGRVVLAVVAGLGLELLGAEGRFLIITPASDSHFLRSGAGIDGEEEGSVLGGGGA